MIAETRIIIIHRKLTQRKLMNIAFFSFCCCCKFGVQYFRMWETIFLCIHISRKSCSSKSLKRFSALCCKYVSWQTRDKSCYLFKRFEQFSMKAMQVWWRIWSVQVNSEKYCLQRIEIHAWKFCLMCSHWI